METQVTQTSALGGAHDIGASRGGVGHAIVNGGVGHATVEEHRQVAVCECGAQLAGGSRLELFQAAERHVAHHHPELVGALELDMVVQMAEDVGGIDADRRPGA